MINELNKQEIKKRETFHSQFSRNYVSNLFPYLNDGFETFIKNELNLNFDVNIPKISETNLKIVENEYNTLRSQLKLDLDELDVYTSEGEVKKFEGIMKKFLIEDDVKQIVGATEEATVSPTDTSTLFLSKLTDTQTANLSSNDDPYCCDEQLILVNKKPAANKEFLQKLDDIYKKEIFSLKQTLVELSENYKQCDTNMKQDYKQIEGFIVSLNKSVVNEKAKKKAFYKNLIKNFFLNNSQQLESDDSDVGAGGGDDNDELDKEFYTSLKENLLKLRDTYEKTIDDTRKSIDQLKIQLIADKQKQFNEAIERVRNEKDKEINDLKANEQSLLSQIDKLNSKLNDSNNDKEEALQRSLVKQQKLVERVQYLESQLNKFLPISSTTANNTLIPLLSSSPIINNTVTTQQPTTAIQTDQKYQPLITAIQLNS